MTGDDRVRGFFVAAGFLFLLAFAAYSNSFGTAFHFDDFHQIVKNPNIRNLDNVPRFFASARMGSYDTGLAGYRPVTYASFAVNHALSGYRVWSYHLLNFVLHFFNALLVYLIARRSFAGRAGDGASMAALVAASLFAAHPVQTAAVTYVSGRAALLASAFCLSAFYCFVRFREGGRAAALWGTASPALFFLGLLSKEMAAGFILIAILYDAVFTFGERKISLRRAAYHAAFVAVLIVFLVARRELVGFFAVEETTHSTAAYLMSEAAALLLYMRLLVLPFNLNADYDLPAFAASDPRVWAGVLVLVFAAFIVFRLRKARPEAAFFGGWFFLALAPESSIFPITDIAVEYRLYFASAGFFAFAAALALPYLRGRAAARTAVASALALLTVLTFARNRVWADEYSLWSDAARKSPHSARAHANVGNALVQEGRYAEAVTDLTRSLDINPFYDQSYNVYNNLGICFFRMNVFGEAIEQFGRSVKVHPGYAEGFANLGAALYETGRYREAAEALGKAVALAPGNARGHMNLAGVYERLGMHYEAMRERDAAEALGLPADGGLGDGR